MTTEKQAIFEDQQAMSMREFTIKVKGCANCVHWPDVPGIRTGGGETQEHIWPRTTRTCQRTGKTTGYAYFCQEWQHNAETLQDNEIANAWIKEET